MTFELTTPSFNYPYLNDSLNDITGEVWKDLNGYTASYLISNFSRVKRLAYTNIQNRSFPDRIILSYNQKRGSKLYAMVYIGKSRFSLANLVANHFVNKPDGCNKLIFKDRNSLNIIPSNIAWVDNETFSLYCNCHSYRSKLNFSREYAIKHSSDDILCDFYKTLNISILNSYWLELRKHFFFRNFKEVENMCYEYFIDRAKRFSILGSPKGLIILYSGWCRRLLKQDVTRHDIPRKILLQTDETLR